MFRADYTFVIFKMSFRTIIYLTDMVSIIV